MKMEHDAFRYDFTISELFFFLFKKKECPRCKKRMTRYKAFESVPGFEFNSRSAAPFRQDANVKHYYYVYKCTSCGASYKLKELVQQKG